MNWKENIARWRSLPPEEKLRRKWEGIPLDVARSMAFEGEPSRRGRGEIDRKRRPAGRDERGARASQPVPVARIRAALARIELPPGLALRSNPSL